jgi:hypothetical protein
MRGLLKASGAIQAASVLTLVAQNLVAPLLMGAVSYGTAMALMALPLLLQGIVEPMVNGVAIAARSGTNYFSVVRRSWAHLGVAVLPVALLTLGLGLQRGATVFHLALLGAFVVLVMVNTALRGLAFARRRHRVLVGHLLWPFVATVVMLPFLGLTGVSGYLGMMCFVQAVVCGVLLGDRQVRAEAAAIVAARRTCASGFDFLRIYAANLAQRASQLALGPGMLLLASGQLAPSRLAEFRVAQIMVGALAYAVPIHPALVQAHAASDEPLVGNPSRGHVKGLMGIMVVGLGLAAVGTVALWLAFPWVAEFLLRRASEGSRVFEFRSMIWAAPFFVSLPVLGGLLLGRSLETVVLVLNLVLVPASVGIGIWRGAAVGFVGGSLALAVSLAVAAWWVLRLDRNSE